jgi:hypothetical protein
VKTAKFWLSLVALISCSQASAQPRVQLTDYTFRQSAAGRQARVVDLLSLSDAQSTARLLLRAPKGDLLVGTGTLKAKTGVTTRKLTDKETGEWLSVARAHSIGAVSLKDYYNRASDIEPDANLRVRYEITTSSGFSWSGTTGWGARTEEELSDILLALRKGGRTDELRGTLSPAMLDAAQFIHCAFTLERPLPYWQDIAAFLIAVAGDRSDTELACRGEPWLIDATSAWFGSHTRETESFLFQFDGSDLFELRRSEDKEVP